MVPLCLTVTMFQGPSSFWKVCFTQMPSPLKLVTVQSPWNWCCPEDQVEYSRSARSLVLELVLVMENVSPLILPLPEVCVLNDSEMELHPLPTWALAVMERPASASAAAARLGIL